MSNMKDYAMWLDDRGIAVWDNNIGELVIPSGINIHDSTIVDEYKHDSNWHMPEPEDDELIIDEEEEEDFLDDEELGDSIEWTPEENWFQPDGGLTADAYIFLANTDLQGDFV